MLRRRPLWLVFGIALAVRLLFVFVFERPILFAHPYTYFTGALRIAEHPEPWHYVATSEEWRTWDKHWTIAPLYFLFVALVFKLTGTSLLALQVVQCLLDAGVATLVAWMGLRLCGPPGAWAGLAYAVYWSAVELPTQTLTENLHTLLSVAGLCLAASAARASSGDEPPGRLRLALLAGLVLGLAALTRSVSSAFVPLVALYLWRQGGWRRGLRTGFLLCLGAAGVILPWTARNVFIIGDLVPIETTAYENILWANHLGTPAEYRAHMDRIGSLPTPAAKREAAMAIAIASVRAHPALFAEKVARNFWHFLRPEGLDGLLRVERSVEPWGHVKSILGDDLLTLAAIPLVLVFALAGRPSPLRTLMLLWCGYFLFMVIVAFHNEVRYRASVAPFAAAAALAGLAVLRDPGASRRRARLVLGIGVALVAASVYPYVGRAGRALRAWAGVRGAVAELREGRPERATQLADAAAERDPASARPYLLYGRALALAGRFDDAVAAYRRTLTRGTLATTAPRLALPALLAWTRRETQASGATRQAHEISWNNDPWLALEVAWAELPPPHTDEIVVGGNDYGAVRGFHQPRGDLRLGYARTGRDTDRTDGLVVPPGLHRWSRQRSWLRLAPRSTADSYDLTVFLGVPPPGRLAAGAVAGLRVGAQVTACGLTADVRPCVLRVPAPPLGQAWLVELVAPVWNRVGEPAEQGVRVERLTVTPAS